MPRVEIFVHPTCSSSRKLVLGLKSRGLLERVRLEVATRPGDRMIWSVPWVVADGEPVAADPVSVDEVASILEGKEVKVGGIEDAFKQALINSSMASSLALLHESLKPVIVRDFVKAALRIPYSGISLSDSMRDLLNQADSIYEDVRDKVVRVLAYSFVRDLWWASSGKIPEGVTINEAVVGAWLLAKASIGRVGLPNVPLLRGHRGVKELTEYLTVFLERIASYIEEEQGSIMRDSEYLSIIGAARM